MWHLLGLMLHVETCWPNVIFFCSARGLFPGFPHALHYPKNPGPNQQIGFGSARILEHDVNDPNIAGYEHGDASGRGRCAQQPQALGEVQPGAR